MITILRLGVLGTLLTGCAAAGLVGSTTTGASSAGASSGGASTTGGDGGGATLIGAPCDPSSVLTVCAQASLVCDQATDTCRMPQFGEQCDAQVGCAAEPPGLACDTAAFTGTPETVCLVGCSSDNSSQCPYGTSCGDQNLPGFCSLEGTPACSPWGRCTLGAGITGDCVPNGTHTTCFANGSQTKRYGPCNSGTVNSDSIALCSPGSMCAPISLSLGAALGPSYCFAFCGGDGGSCATSEHCDRPSPDVYGLCRPGVACALDRATCPAGTACIPDDPRGLAGGCLLIGPDAGRIGDPCVLPGRVSASQDCQAGACLPADGGYACTPLCNLADGGRPYCVHQACTPLVPGDQTDVIGACR